MKNLLIISCQHTLLAEQEAELIEQFGKGSWDTQEVPAAGWKLSQMTELFQNCRLAEYRFIFVSPIPVLIRDLVKKGYEVLIFHNDNREKKELPGGRIIYTVPKMGWQLL